MSWKGKGYTEAQIGTVLKMADLGYTNQAIADRLNKSRQTVEKLRRKLIAQRSAERSAGTGE